MKVWSKSTRAEFMWFLATCVFAVAVLAWGIAVWFMTPWFVAIPLTAVNAYSFWVTAFKVVPESWETVCVLLEVDEIRAQLRLLDIEVDDWLREQETQGEEHDSGGEQSWFDLAGEGSNHGAESRHDDGDEEHDFRGIR